MALRPVLLAAGLALLIGGGFPLPAAAGQKHDATARLPANEIQAKLPNGYLALPRLHMAVEVDANRRFRALEIEAWIRAKDEENLALARSNKKQIAEALRTDLAHYDWEAFEDSRAGVDIAKQIVSASVERVSGAQVDDVVIKSLILK